MGEDQTQSDLIDQELAAPDSLTHIDASLQCFAGYTGDDGDRCDAEDPALYDRAIVPVTIQTLSLRRVTTESVPDLRIGAIIRLRIPTLGWRHLEVRWIANGRAGCDFLLPLLPYELRTALEGWLGRDTPQPPRPDKALAHPASRKAPARKSPRRRTPRKRPLPVVSGMEAASRAMFDVVRRFLVASPSLTMFPRTAIA